MAYVQFTIDNKNKGSFFILEDGEKLGEMEVSLTPAAITVYHTEVLPKAEGKGLAKKLLETMVDYAKKNALQVIPLCPYVFVQFKRHPEEYAEVWTDSKP